MLEAELQADILRLYFTEHMTRRKIARQLGVHRKTVASVIEKRRVQIESSCRSSRPSMLEPYYPRIQQLLEEAPERSAVNILQRLRGEGYEGGITILRQYVSTQRPSPPQEAFLQLDFAPGEAAQVDWGEFGDVFNNGTLVHVFAMVLCWSRQLYLEFTQRETLPALLRCYERALHFFGGRCREYWHDNPTTVVAERRGKLARFQPQFLAYAGFHAFKPVLCGVRKPHEKGRVEDVIKLIRYQFWPGRQFTDMADLNRQACEWRDQFANRREHEATGKIPELLFEQEKPALLPLRPELYETDDVLSCPVSKFYRIRFDKNTYTVPWTLCGKTLTVKGDDQCVRIFYHDQLVTTHERCFRRGKDIPHPDHDKGLRERKAAGSRSWERDTIRSYGPHAQRYLELIAAGRRSLRLELRELLCLATVYGSQELEETIGQLLVQGIVGTNHLERTLRLSENQPKAPPPLELKDERLRPVPPTPDLQSYDSLLLEKATHEDEAQDDEIAQTTQPRSEDP